LPEIGKTWSPGVIICDIFYKNCFFTTSFPPGNFVSLGRNQQSIQSIFMKLSHFLPAMIIALSIFSGCSTMDDKENILGIWRVNSSMVEGREIGDAKGWFEFKSDGTVDTRPRPGKYDTGNYKLDTEKHKLSLFSEAGGMDYDYKMDGNKMELSAVMPNDMKLLLKCEKVDAYPITKENDTPEEGPMVQP
jgi:hypothetical protein